MDRVLADCLKKPLVGAGYGLNAGRVAGAFFDKPDDSAVHKFLENPVGLWIRLSDADS